MIDKHVDLIAIAVILVGIAVFSHAHKSFIKVFPTHRIIVTGDWNTALPEMPPLPCLRFITQ